MALTEEQRQRLEDLGELDDYEFERGMEEEDLEDRQRRIISHVRSNSPFDHDTTERIIRKVFKRIQTPVRILTSDRWRFDELEVFELGCDYGETLLYWGEGSKGGDIRKDSVEFLTALGQDVFIIDANNDLDGVEDGSFEATYNNNLIEHLDSPYLFLRHLHRILKPEGLLAIGYPTIPPVPFDRIWGKLLGYKGWLSPQHLYFFNFKSFQDLLRRAGFEPLKNYRFRRLWKWPILPSLIGVTYPSCLTVARRIDDFNPDSPYFKDGRVKHLKDKQRWYLRF